MKESTVFNLLLIVLVLFSSCKKKEESVSVKPPTVITSTVYDVTDTSAVVGGNITANGGSSVTQRGVCWSDYPNPSTLDNVTNYGVGSGSFTHTLSGLNSNTTYFVRAYAINSAGTAYGNEVIFTTEFGESSVVTYPGEGVTFDGYTYASIVLDNGQEWMTENLRTAVYANGDPIPNITDNTQWSNLTTGAWTHYNNDIQYENPYGKLYNWYVADDPRNVCPNGWHLPTDEEWSLFINYIDSLANGGSFGNIAGGKMKSTGYEYWVSPNKNATNESNFSGLPGGYRRSNGTFNAIGANGRWWSSTEDFTNVAWFRGLSYYYGDASRDFEHIRLGLSVRCLKD